MHYYKKKNPIILLGIIENFVLLYKKKHMSNSAFPKKKISEVHKSRNAGVF